MTTVLSPSLFNTAGRIAIVGYGAVNAFGTANTSFLTRTGRFEEALPEYRRLMGVADGPGARDYIDRNIGIRTPLPQDMEDGSDIQRFQGFRGERLKEDTLINGRLWRAGDEVLLPRTWKLPVCHAGVLPTGWDLRSEMGLSGKPWDKFSEAHLIMMRMLAEALVTTGLDWSTIEDRIAPEQRKVASGPGMAPGKCIRDGMVNPYLSRKIAKDQLAWYLADNPAFWLAKVLNARHASTRVAACNTGIANMEDLLTYMRSHEILLGAVATFESAINETSITGFNEQKALANDRSVAMLNDHPSLVSRPGLANRSGFVMGKGGAILLLMPWDVAVELGAIIYGEFLSAATALGPFESADPAAPTNGVELAMARGVLEAARIDGVTPGEFIQTLDFINGHGTSTPVGDQNGIACYDAGLKHFGRDRRRPVWVVYAKGGPRLEDIESARQVGGIGTGHLLGGASSAATVEDVSVHNDGILPAAVSGLSELDPKILKAEYLVPTTAPTRDDAQVGMAESEGFGDSNGVAFTRAFRPERYAGGLEHVARQGEATDRRNENFAAIRSGAKKPSDFLPLENLKKK